MITIVASLLVLSQAPADAVSLLVVAHATDTAASRLVLSQAPAETAPLDDVTLPPNLQALPAETAVAEPEPVAAPDPDEAGRWPGELRRVHFGVGARLHGGAMFQDRSTQLLLQSEVVGVITTRLRKHDELRVQLGLNLGYPDLFGGESNVSYRHHFNERWSVGGGAFVVIGAPSIRAGLEIPVAFRLGATRRHELSLALRVHAGVFNGSSYLWYEFPKQRFAIAADAAFAYTFIF